MRRLLFGCSIALVLFAGAASSAPSATVALGRRLFADDRFAAPQGDFATSCASCHFFDENAQGRRAGADFLARSWIPWRSADPRRHTVRNTPTILDVAAMPALHFDGEFRSIEALVSDTITGRTLGWLPEERAAAAARAHAVVSKGEYPRMFADAYGVDLMRAADREALDLITRAISDYLRSLSSPHTSAYDAFIADNGLPDGTDGAIDIADLARRVMSGIDRRSEEQTLVIPVGFSRAALEGLRVFFDTRRGNCTTCHPPPLFTDRSYHNIGISQAEFDAVHGDGRFAGLTVPSANTAVRPVASFRETPEPGHPDRVDLGYWNFVDVRRSPLRRPAETDRQFLDRMIATFKTPTLRNLAFTSPYMHNGAYQNLHDTLSEMIRLNSLARDGRVRNADDAFTAIRIGEADLEPLAAFLATLNDKK